MRAVLGALLAVVAALAPSAARAADEAPAVAIVVEGPEAKTLRADLDDAIPQRFDIIAAKDVAEALKLAGLKGKLGDGVAVAKKRGRLAEQLGKVASSLSANATLVVQVRKQKKNKLEAHVLLVDAKGDVLVDQGVPLAGGGKSLGKRKKKVREADVAKLADVITAGLAMVDEPAKAAAAPPPPKAAPVPAASPEPAPVASAESTTAAPEDAGATSAWDADGSAEALQLLDAAVGVEVSGRHFIYTDPITANLRPYDVMGVPVPALSLQVYPLARSGITVLKDLGLEGGFSRAVGLSSQVEGGDTLTTTWQRWNAGLRGRIRLGGPTLGVHTSVGGLDFTFDGGGDVAGELPSVSYFLQEVGLDGRFPLGESLSLLAGASYLNLLEGGEVSDRFPQSSAAGVEGGLGFGYKVASSIEARVELAYTHVFYEMKPEVGDDYVAGGALDQFYGLRLSAAYQQ